MSIQEPAARPYERRRHRARTLLRHPGCSVGLALTLTACAVGGIADPGTSTNSPPGDTVSGGTGSMAGLTAGGVAGSSGGVAGSTPGSSSSGGVTMTGDGGVPAVVLAPSSRLARLSHTQLLNTYRDLLGITDVSAADATLTLDGVVGFDNESDSLFVTDALWGNLQQIAELYSHTVATNAKLLANLIPANAPTDTTGKATAMIKAFGLRAYRRPLTDAEVQTYVTMFGQGTTLVGGSDPFAAGAELVLQAFLQSPYFIYRMELGDQVGGGRIPLSDYEAASKLSYAVTNTMPDPALLAAAGLGKVAHPSDLASQAQRLLATPAATAAVEHFHFQMYRFGVYDGITKDPKVYPNFTAATGSAMRQESLLFLDWVFNGGKGVADIYTSPVSFVNNLLAPTYGLPGTFTSAFTQVNLDPTQRSGLLTQLGFLAAEATTNDISTIHRGAFVDSRVFCVLLPPPSPLAKPLPPITPGETDRQLVDGFTGPGTCAAGCHATLINPPGFAFENYDSVGAYRTTDQGQPINAADSYTFADPYGKQSFKNAIDFAKVVSKAPEAHNCYVQNWASYLYGRPVADGVSGALLTSDAAYLQYLSGKSLDGGLSVKDLIVSIATNDNFLARSPQVN